MDFMSQCTQIYTFSVLAPYNLNGIHIQLLLLSSCKPDEAQLVHCCCSKPKVTICKHKKIAEILFVC